MNTKSKQSNRAGNPIADNPGFTGTVAVLIEKGYRCASQFERKLTAEDRGVILPETHWEIWVGGKGCVVVQVWKDGNGCNVYTDWNVGHTFDELRAAL